MRNGSLCSGYGGLDLAVEFVFGARTVWHAEVADAPSRILAARWPGVPNLGDLTRIEWAAIDPVDIVTAGYPCQPFSIAGLKKGTDDHRHLWPHIAEAIRHLRPRYVVLENVANHRRIGFGSVLGDLAALGFDAQWTSLRASDVGAAHARERVFVLAYPADAPPDRRPLRIAEQEQGGASAVQPEHSAAQRSAATDTGSEEFPRWTGLRADDSAGLWGPRLSDGDDDSDFDWRQYRPAVDRWAAIVGRRPSRPVVKGRNAGRSLSARFVEWMMGLPAGWVTDVQGVNRTQALEALGNGVVPQQAVAALRWLLSVSEVVA